MENDIRKRNVILYDPHPGIGGALVPLPQPMKQAADRLNGTCMKLEDALTQLEPIAQSVNGDVHLSIRDRFIGFGYCSMTPLGKARHLYRLIRYREEA